ncbi:MAG TPA: polyprenyl synthetase family protein [Thermoplasmata archaeon]|nr:polyprenyl synthetase family protein [Thermoplasmata archaeon]
MGVEAGLLLQRELAEVDALIRASIRSDESLLTEIAEYVIGAGGKRVRPQVTLLAFRAVGGGDPAAAIRIAAALELIHSASLLHDDINDGGTLRRGREAAYRKFGLQNALVTGDFLYVKSFAIGGKFPEDIIDLTASVCTSLAEGEVRQKRLAGNVHVTREEYLDVIRRKTALPISAGARIGALLGGGRPEEIDALTEYGLNLGIAFQVVDDILDVVGDERVLGKRVGSDVFEGNVTLLSIHALNDGATIDTRLLARLLRKKRKSEAEVSRALDLIRQSGAVEKARVDAGRYGYLAKRALDGLRDTAAKADLLDLADFVVSRER